jgi:hypothetical protein
MHTNDRWSDEEILAELAEALQAQREVPGELIEAGRALFTMRSLDAELAELQRAELTYDSFVDDAALQGSDQGLLVVTRSETAALRSLTYAASELSIELEVTADGVLGQVVPPQLATVMLFTPDQGRREVPCDDVGWFTIRPVPRIRFRIGCSTKDAGSIVTEWITL